MKRRDFLKALAIVAGAAAVPSWAHADEPEAEVTPEWREQWRLRVTEVESGRLAYEGPAEVTGRNGGYMVTIPGSALSAVGVIRIEILSSPHGNSW